MNNSTLDISPQRGTVITKYGTECLVEKTNGDRLHCKTPKKLPAIVCGDIVMWQSTSVDQGRIIHLEQRNTLLVRPDKRGNLKPVAANIDQILIVCAAKPTLSEELIDNYLIAAEALEIKPILIFNKIDILDKQELRKYQSILKHFEIIGYQIWLTSTYKPELMDSFTKHLEHHTSIFVGQSGVGKSSLINHLLPELELQTKELTNISKLGKHTTSNSTLYHLDNSGNIIDSPGVREFGLWKMDTNKLAWAFKEFRQYLSDCQFRNCKHQNEPGCSVKQAVQDRYIEQRRYNSYLGIVSKYSI